MKLFSKLYAKAMIWSRHRHAPYYLGGLSFAESSFFPIPPDIMLAPMSLSQPKRAWRFAALTTIASVLGGMLGYLIGSLFEPFIVNLFTKLGYYRSYESDPLILAIFAELNYVSRYTQVKELFSQYGVLIVFIAGFTPIPYKVFTITAGVMGMALLPFIGASLIGRGGRFFLVSGCMVWGGEKMEAGLHKYIDRITWALLIVLSVYIGLKYLGAI